jgi:transcriptional regulator with XRE-family HTH domain
MTMFGETLRRLRTEQGYSLGQFATRVHYNKGYLSRIEAGLKAPTEAVARQCDLALNARGELIAAAHLDIAAARDTKPSVTTELLRRVQASDVSTDTIESIHATVADLCCQYGRDALQLRSEAHDWLRELGRLLRHPVGLRQHQEALVAAGWLALLIGCLEADLGMRASAEATRVTAAQLGTESGATEIVGWSHEMAAWFALTQGRFRDVLDAAAAGREAAAGHGVVVQLAAQEAKALGRMGDIVGVRSALEEGRQLLDRMPAPSRPDHHFAVDPTKWDFYAMDAYRLGGDDDQAVTYAEEVLRNGRAPDGTERAPMRMAEARLTLAVAAARRGELEQATDLGAEAFGASRRSLPSLLMVAGELDGELQRRWPKERSVAEFRQSMRMLS